MTDIQREAPASPVTHPFASSTSMLEIIPSTIDVEEESRLYDQLLAEGRLFEQQHPTRPYSPAGPPSIISKDIWLEDNSSESKVFARDVTIDGWTNVGDKLGGAYVVYDCAIKTKEGTTIHIHKRYSAFLELYQTLRRTLPQHQRHFVPSLPPKTSLARYRPAFLERRRQNLQYWLSTVLLHPDIGSTKAVRLWVTS